MKFLANCRISAITNRYCKLEVNTEAVGRVCVDDMHPVYDVAVFHPSEKHGYSVNKLNGLDAFTLSRADSLNAMLPDGVEVYKYGVATHVTIGKVFNSRKVSPVFFVESLEVGPLVLVVILVR